MDGRNAGNDWWRHAVVYQIYPRSFADANGDGVGDVAGIRSKIPYLAALGIDALWISPWYPSPMKDAGYDVSDYRDIEPLFGTLAEADGLISEAHEAGIKVIIDIVPNHTSDQHVLFKQAVAAAAGSPERALFVFRDGRGDNGELPPNDWQSTFGGPAWTRVADGQWYLHLFTPEQPDVDWRSPAVRSEFEQTLRFWFDRGVDGFRIDVAHGLEKDWELPDLNGLEFPLADDDEHDHPHWDQPNVHDVYRQWRAIAEEYTPSRAFCGEIWVGRPHRLAAYLRPDELHTAFNFDFLMAPWLPAELRNVIDATIASHAAVGAPPTWVIGNHDVARPVSRYAREQVGLEPGARNLVHFQHLSADFDLGRRRARAAALLMFALPGSSYVYEGEELGLPEAEDIPAEALQDPIWAMSGGTDKGRDGCRVPLPWTAGGHNYGFSPEGGADPWLPQPADWAPLAADAQDGQPGSTLELYRTALGFRRQLPELGDGTLEWLETSPEVLAYARPAKNGEAGLQSWTNFGPEPLTLPAGEVLLASGELLDGLLPSDTTVWLLDKTFSE